MLSYQAIWLPHLRAARPRADAPTPWVPRPSERMQTLRKLPMSSAEDAGHHVEEGRSPAQISRHADLVEKNAGSDRDVERLGARLQGECPRDPSRGRSSVGRPRRRPHCRARGEPAACERRGATELSRRRPSVTQVPASWFPAQTLSVSGSVATQGRRNSAPMLPRMTLGLLRSAVPGRATTPGGAQGQRGAQHGADVAGVLHSVEHQDGATGGSGAMSSRNHARRLDDGDDALGVLGVGQLAKRPVVNASSVTPAPARAP